MTESIPDAPADPASPQSQPARRLQLHTHVTADFLARIEPELAAALFDRLASRGSRFYDSKFAAALFLAVKLLSVFGLILSLFLLAMGGAVFYSVRIDVVFIGIFSVLLFWFWNKDKSTARLRARYRPLWRRLAGRGARRMLKVAARTAPFDAEYDLRGDWLTYYRSKNGKHDFAWARRMSGLRVGGNGFTLLFKKESAAYPYMIVLHDASTELEACLDAAGIRTNRQSAQPSATDS
jgi:hypothetical protein